MKKVICVIANGYAEEMMASMLMGAIQEELDADGFKEEYLFIGGSLVSSGNWFYNAHFPTFFSGGISPSGGFPTRSLKGFASDIMSGEIQKYFQMKKTIKQWSQQNLVLTIAVGDFILMMNAASVMKKKKIPLVFIPTAKSNYITPHFGIEKANIKKYASISFPRDQITTDDFNASKISAEYCGNLMQDLLDMNATPMETKKPLIALLPGSREESYGNFAMILEVVEKIFVAAEYALVQASSLDAQKFMNIFIQNGWVMKSDTEYPTWTKHSHEIVVYPGSKFDSVALSCVTAISLAGTVGDQIVGLGKPIIGFKGTGPQSSESRMIEYQKLLGDAFLYEKNFPLGVVNTVERILIHTSEREARGKVGQERMGERGATKLIAQKIVNYFLKEK